MTGNFWLLTLAVSYCFYFILSQSQLMFMRVSQLLFRDCFHLATLQESHCPSCLVGLSISKTDSELQAGKVSSDSPFLTPALLGKPKQFSFLHIFQCYRHFPWIQYRHLFPFIQQFYKVIFKASRTASSLLCKRTLIFYYHVLIVLQTGIILTLSAASDLSPDLL